MTDAVAHRGPDGDGVATFGDECTPSFAGFGHRRLSIIDLSENGRQPITVRCPCCGSAGLDDLALTYNGEIYNYRELRAELESKGHRFFSGTDSEVVLHLYAELGVEMLARLNGIFAFAIRDGRGRSRPTGVEAGDVFVARDHLGVKPLYYAETRSGFLFASEIKALLRSGEIGRKLDPVALHEALAYLWTPAPRTALAGIRKLPPGHALIARGGRVIRSWQHYTPPHYDRYLSGDADQIAVDLRAVLGDAVERQMVADVSVGAFLSGGLDSTSVVAMMRDANPGSPPTCYSIGFDRDVGVDGSPEDLPFARRAAEHLGVPLHVIEIGPDAIGYLDQMLIAVEEPQADPAPINAMLIARAARERGQKVLLSGTGGDDVFSGYRRHRALLLERYWAWLPQPGRRAVAAMARAVGRRPIAAHGARVRRFAKAFAYADLPPSERMVAYFWWSDEPTRRALYSSDMAAATRSVRTADPLLATLAAVPSQRDPLDQMLELERRHFLADHNLNYTDKVAMASGIEVRVPLLDLAVVDFAARIPPRLKQTGSVGKAIFKRAMERDLPHDLIYRPKTGFGVPLRRWLTHELREMVDDVLSDRAIRHRGLFEPAAVRRLVQLDREGVVDGAYTIFALLCIELWCRHFVDGLTT